MFSRASPLTCNRFFRMEEVTVAASQPCTWWLWHYHRVWAIGTLNSPCHWHWCCTCLCEPWDCWRHPLTVRVKDNLHMSSGHFQENPTLQGEQREVTCLSSSAFSNVTDFSGRFPKKKTMFVLPSWASEELDWLLRRNQSIFYREVEYLLFWVPSHSCGWTL